MFGLDLINPVSILSLAASPDPCSRGLTYLPDDKNQIALKQLSNKNYCNN